MFLNNRFTQIFADFFLFSYFVVTLVFEIREFAESGFFTAKAAKFFHEMHERHERN